MCIGIPGQIREIIESANRIAQVDISGRLRTVDLGLLSPDEGAVGDWVLVHAGMAISRMEADEAHGTLALLQELDEFGVEEQP
jgi:hydrogenase expression/formation protein HypC